MRNMWWWACCIPDLLVHMYAKSDTETAHMWYTWRRGGGGNSGTRSMNLRQQNTETHGRGRTEHRDAWQGDDRTQKHIEGGGQITKTCGREMTEYRGAWKGVDRTQGRVEGG